MSAESTAQVKSSPSGKGKYQVCFTESLSKLLVEQSITHSHFSHEMMSAPVRRINEILALPHAADDFTDVELHPSDDDSWLYNGEDGLNSALLERQKEMELYNMKQKKKQKSKEQQDAAPLSGTNLNDFDLDDMAKTMQAFVRKVSSYEGAEVPENSFSTLLSGLYVWRVTRDLWN